MPNVTIVFKIRLSVKKWRYFTNNALFLGQRLKQLTKQGVITYKYLTQHENSIYINLSSPRMRYCNI